MKVWIAAAMVAALSGCAGSELARLARPMDCRNERGVHVACPEGVR